MTTFTYSFTFSVRLQLWYLKTVFRVQGFLKNIGIGVTNVADWQVTNKTAGKTNYCLKDWHFLHTTQHQSANLQILERETTVPEWSDARSAAWLNSCVFVKKLKSFQTDWMMIRSDPCVEHCCCLTGLLQIMAKRMFTDISYRHITEKDRNNWLI